MLQLFYMNSALEFGKIITKSNVPFFDGGMLVWSGVFVAVSIILSIMTWRAQTGLSSRSLIYWGANAIAFCIGIFFFTKAFPRLPAGWILAGLFILLFAISGATVVTKSKEKEKKEDDKEKK